MVSNDHVKEAIENLKTELIEKSLKEKRENDEVYKKDFSEMNKQIAEFEEVYLGEDEKERFEEVKNLMYSTTRDEAEHLYVQGIKDGVSLLKELGVIR